MWTTLIAIAAVAIAGGIIHGWPRYWVFTGIWVVYFAICAWGMGSVRMQFYCPAICRGKIGGMRVALTFDDGPDPGATPQLLDLLQREKIPAVFFCIGKNVDAHPELAARIVAEGHLLENHTYRHPWWISCLTSRALTDEMTRTQRAIQQAAGVTPRYLRSPAGLTNPHFPRALRRAGLTLVGWDVRPFDTAGRIQDAIDRIIRETRDGSIVLLHDGGVPAQQILTIVSTAITELRARGFGFERLDRLID
ncbi:MAG TPA: polysaccharide deacetylase family protein [Tepidisphaeraceae bacterium]|nr:polysaccharide deacetylase family protein [Tepidisphaeraceae bacterium]